MLYLIWPRPLFFLLIGLSFIKKQTTLRINDQGQAAPS